MAILNGQPRYRAIEVPRGEDLVDAVVAHAPTGIVIDSRLGRQPYAVDLVAAVTRRAPAVAVLISVHAARPMGLAEALLAGARGLILREAPASDWLTAVAAVLRGQEWIAQPLAELLRTQLDPQRLGWEAPELSEREMQVLRLVAVGGTNAGIAESLALSENTVRNHLHSVMAKLRAGTRTEAVAIARELGMLDPPLRG